MQKKPKEDEYPTNSIIRVVGLGQVPKMERANGKISYSNVLQTMKRPRFSEYAYVYTLAHG